MLTKVTGGDVLYEGEFNGALPTGRVLIARDPTGGVYMNLWNKRAVRGGASVLRICDENMIPIDAETRKLLEIEAVVDNLMPQAEWTAPWERSGVMDSTSVINDFREIDAILRDADV